jgi:hypothetical protein
MRSAKLRNSWVETREQASRMRDAVEDGFAGYPSSSSEPAYDSTLQRYLRRPQPGDEQNGFCPTCNSINFAEIAAFDIMGSTEPYERTDHELEQACRAVFHLSMDQLAVETGCPLCQMFRAFLDSVSQRSGNIVGLRLVRMTSGYSNPIQLGMAIQYDDREWPDIPNVMMHFWPPDGHGGYAGLDAVCGSLRVDVPWLQRTLEKSSARFGPYGHPEPGDRSVRPSQRSHVTTGGVEDMYLINCSNINNLRVVHAPPAARYLALSYVWGRDDPSGSDDPDPLYINGHRNPVTPTIADAIRLTHILGMQYLWNDYYCISQDHHEHKSHQLKLMGKIFGGAWATIVALGSNNKTHLPGLFFDRKAPPFTSVPGGGFLAFKLKSQMSHSIGKSTWSTRGWTFQENALSPRLIYFCDNEVIVQTRLGTEPERDAYGEYFSDAERRHANAKADIRDLYPLAVKEYMDRNLTSASDNLDAFRGYLAETSQQTYQAVSIIRSTPVLTHEGDFESGLCSGLLWLHNISHMDDDEMLTAQLRLSAEGDGIPNIPSWSWISCRWPVSGHNLFDLMLAWDSGGLGSQSVSVTRRCSICIDLPGHGVLPFNVATAQLDLDSGASRFRTKAAFRMPSQEYPEIKTLCIQGKSVTCTLMNTHEPPVEHDRYARLPLPSHYYSCRLGSVIEGDETRFFQSACFYPDYGRIGKSHISAAFSNTGKALFLATLTETQRNGRQEEYFCFLALNKVPRSDQYARVGVIVAISSEPRSGRLEYGGAAGNKYTSGFMSSEPEWVLEQRESLREFAGRHRNGRWWEMMQEIEGRREEMVRVG